MYYFGNYIICKRGYWSRGVSVFHFYFEKVLTLKQLLKNECFWKEISVFKLGA